VVDCAHGIPLDRFVFNNIAKTTSEDGIRLLDALRSSLRIEHFVMLAGRRKKALFGSDNEP
jgi:hypothetical protein